MPNVTYQRRLLAGLCVGCEGQPRAGRRTCLPCGEKAKAAARASTVKHGHTRQRRRQAGLCECGQPPEDGFAFCAPCRAKSSMSQKRHMARRRSAGLCLCGRPRLDGAKQCQGCRESKKELAAARKAAGQCVRCPQAALPGRVRCGTCRERVAARQARSCRDAAEKVFAHYGLSCACCGESRRVFLSIDHIGGGGTKHRESLGGKSGSGFYKWLVRQGFPKGYRTLCFNCNCGAGFRSGGTGVCPCSTWDESRLRRSAGTLAVF